MNKNCASFFAGVGGIDLGFENAGFHTIYANEIEPKAAMTYELNFDTHVDTRDIKIVADELERGIDPIGEADIFLAGFPCQAFSIAGYRQGFNDEKGRGNLFFELMKIIRIKKPKIIFLENVKNLLTHDNGNTFSIIHDCLTTEGYHITYKILNSMNYGNVPQNRERIYIIAFEDKNLLNAFKWIEPITLTKKLSSVFDYDTKQEDKYYYTKDNFKHYDTIKEIIKDPKTVYQWRRVYVRENKNNVCPTLTANMGTGGHNVPLIYTKYGIRKLTPRECFSIQGFPSTFKLPEKLVNSHLYKQAGNSVSVSVIERIAIELNEIINKKERG